MIQLYNPKWFWRSKLKIESIDEIKQAFDPWFNDDSNFDTGSSAGGWECKVQTSLGKSTEGEPWDTWKKHFNPMVKSFCDDVKFTGKRVLPEEYWGNKYSIGSYQEVHEHILPGINISFCYFYEVSEDNFRFLDTESDITRITTLASSIDELLNPIDWVEPLDQTIGELLIWPSYYRHMVRPCTKERKTISGNLFLEPS